MDKQKKTAAELEELVKVRMGAGDFRVTVHPSSEFGWHATIYGRRSAEVDRCQTMADSIVAEFSITSWRTSPAGGGRYFLNEF